METITVSKTHFRHFLAYVRDLEKLNGMQKENNRSLDEIVKDWDFENWPEEHKTYSVPKMTMDEFLNSPIPIKK